MIPFIPFPLIEQLEPVHPQPEVVQTLAFNTLEQFATATTTTVPNVPFYSQFKDISSPVWQKKGCGIASLAMVIDYYKEEVPSVNTLLREGIAKGAYLSSAGWTYAGLITVAKKYGLDGESYDLAKSSSMSALAQFKIYLKDGPVIASIHYKFDPKSTVPHLVVINGIKDEIVYYNDPAANAGEKQIAVADFLKAWKKRFIVVRPIKENAKVAFLQE